MQKKIKFLFLSLIAAMFMILPVCAEGSNTYSIHLLVKNENIYFFHIFCEIIKIGGNNCGNREWIGI